MNLADEDGKGWKKTSEKNLSFDPVNVIASLDREKIDVIRSILELSSRGW